jgi:hypothetical protein
MRSNTVLCSLVLTGVLFAHGTRAHAQTAPAPAAAAAPAAPAPAPQNVQQAVTPAHSGQLESAFNKTDSVVSAGLALGGINGAAGSSSMPPIFGGFDYAISPEFSIGAMGAYYRSNLGYGYGGDVHYSYTTLAARGDWHFGKYVPIEKLDLYGGFLLGYGIVSVSGPSGWSGASANLIVWGANLGARYYFTKSLAAQVELGVGLGNLSLGLAYKL